MTININGSFLVGIAAVVSALGSSLAAVFGALNHGTAKEIIRQTNGINSVLQTRIDTKDKEIKDLKNGGTT